MCKSINSSDVQLRPANKDDAYCLWEWANDPVTRRNSFNPEPIPWATHKAWYAARLASPDTRLWILELNRVPVGQIRYDRTDAGTAQISFSVAPDSRRRNLGTQLLRLSADLAGRELGVRRVEGVTFEGNLGSINAFVKAGFELAEQREIAGHGCLIFRRACRPESDGESGNVLH